MAGSSWIRVSAAQNSRANALVVTAAKDGATTSAGIRERSARLYTGNGIPL
jgi:hypothetical protein